MIELVNSSTRLGVRHFLFLLRPLSLMAKVAKVLGEVKQEMMVTQLDLYDSQLSIMKEPSRRHRV